MLRAIGHKASHLFLSEPNAKKPATESANPASSSGPPSAENPALEETQTCSFCNATMPLALFLSHLDECGEKDEDGWGDDDANAWDENAELAPPEELKRQSSGASTYLVDMLEAPSLKREASEKSKVMAAAMPLCPICQERFPAQLFDTHYSECFARLPSNSCPMCFQKFASPGALEAHCMVCTGSPLASCPLCFVELPQEQLATHASLCQGEVVSTTHIASDEALAKALQQQEDEAKKRPPAAVAVKEFTPGLGPQPIPTTVFHCLSANNEFPHSQSWRGIAESLKRTASSSTPYANDCFRRMLLKEDELCQDFFVFYHSYSYIAVCYEVQACLARCIYGLAPDFGPLPRLLKAPFDGKPCLDLLLAEFSSMSGQDHNPAFRAMAISANTTLFSQDEGAPIQSFLLGYSCTDLSFRSVLLDILSTCGLHKDSAERIIDNIAQLCAQYQLDASGIGSKATGVVATNVQGINRGHMVQLFIHKSIVDDLAYASRPMGILDPSRMPLSKHLRGVASGQARIFMHPTLFCDPDCARIFHYPADPGFAHNRNRFQKELEALLEPILSTEAAMLRAFKGIEGIKPGGDLEKAALARFYGSRQAAQSVAQWKDTMAAAKKNSIHKSAAEEWKSARQQAYGMMKVKALAAHKDKVENAHSAALTVQRREELDKMMAEALACPSTARGIQGKYDPPDEIMLKLKDEMIPVPARPEMKIAAVAEVAIKHCRGTKNLKLVFEGKTIWHNGERKGPETLAEHRIPNKAKIHVLL